MQRYIVAFEVLGGHYEAIVTAHHQEDAKELVKQHYPAASICNWWYAPDIRGINEIKCVQSALASILRTLKVKSCA